MNFSKAFELMKNGAKVKLPSWGGYWSWEDNSIKMYCKDGRIVDIKDMENVNYTFTNIASDEWVIADEENIPILGGEALFGFGEVLKYLKRNIKVARKGWNGKGMWIELQIPDEYSKMTRPYIYMCLPFGSTNHFGNNAKELDRIPWLPSQTDIFAEDWLIVE